MDFFEKIKCSLGGNQYQPIGKDYDLDVGRDCGGGSEMGLGWPSYEEAGAAAESGSAAVRNECGPPASGTWCKNLVRGITNMFTTDDKEGFR